ncbi:MAG: GNAT family N-acetyltransferase [Terracoccus sp.]
MEIIPLDRDDDVLLKGIFGMCTRSEQVSRVHPVRRTFEEFASGVRFAYPGEREEAVVAIADGEPVGWARLYLPQRDNLEKCWAELTVDPDHRGAGVGSTLVAWVEERARANGRSMLLAEVFVPVSQRESHPDRRFVLRRGYRVSSVEIVRTLPLPLDEALLSREEQRSTAAMGDHYDVTLHVDGVPERLRQGVCDCSNRLILDAPTGDVDFEPETMTVQDYQTNLDHFRESGRTLLTAVAVHRESGVVAAYSDLAYPVGDPDIVFQWGTLVLPEHRGHRLGMAVKVANLRQLARVAPDRVTIQTMNDEQNPWMVEINIDLGFVVTEEALSVAIDL